MKKFLKTTLVLIALSTGGQLMSQGPPPPPSGAGAHGATGNQTGGNAPIGGGLFILLGLGAAYGGKKLYLKNREEIE